MARDRDGRPDAHPARVRRPAAEVGRLTTADSGPRDEATRRPPPAPPGPEADLRIDVREGSPVRVRLSGELDLRTAAGLGDRLRPLSSSDVVIECEALRFVDSIGVSTLVRLHHDFQERGGTLCLRGVTGVPRRTLEILGLTETLDIDLREP